MPDEHELTIRIEETASGDYRARVDGASERHFAECEDPIEAARGALAVARGVVDSAVEYDRSARRGPRPD